MSPLANIDRILRGLRYRLDTDQEDDRRRVVALERLYKRVPALTIGCNQSVADWMALLPGAIEDAVRLRGRGNYYQGFRHDVLKAAGSLATGRCVKRRPPIPEALPFIQFWIAVRRERSVEDANAALGRVLDKIDQLRPGARRQ